MLNIERSISYLALLDSKLFNLLDLAVPSAHRTLLSIVLCSQISLCHEMVISICLLKALGRFAAQKTMGWVFNNTYTSGPDNPT